MSEKKLCFVIGPIGDPGTDVRCHADWLFDGIIKPVFAEHFTDDFEVPIRADQIVAPGSINTQVITRLFEVPLVIADLSLHNANAFYELAIRHMKQLPTIHMIHKDDKLPFDVAAFRAIYFSRKDFADVETARASLKSTVEQVMKPGFVVENPITHARGVIKLSEHASPEQRVLLDRLEALEQQMRKLDRSVSQGRPTLATLGESLNPAAHVNSLLDLHALGLLAPEPSGTADIQLSEIVKAIQNQRGGRTTYPSE